MNIQNAFQGAIKKGQNNMEKYVKSLQEQNEQIIDSQNWIMKNFQKIANKLGVELDDPLEEE